MFNINLETKTMEQEFEKIENPKKKGFIKRVVSGEMTLTDKIIVGTATAVVIGGGGYLAGRYVEKRRGDQKAAKAYMDGQTDMFRFQNLRPEFKKEGGFENTTRIYNALTQLHRGQLIDRGEGRNRR